MSNGNHKCLVCECVQCQLVFLSARVNVEKTATVQFSMCLLSRGSLQAALGHSVLLLSMVSYRYSLSSYFEYTTLLNNTKYRQRWGILCFSMVMRIAEAEDFINLFDFLDADYALGDANFLMATLDRFIRTQGGELRASNPIASSVCHSYCCCSRKSGSEVGWNYRRRSG